MCSALESPDLPTKNPTRSKSGDLRASITARQSASQSQSRTSHAKPKASDRTNTRSSNDTATTLDLDHGTEETRQYRTRKTHKVDDELKDAESTGRKRAAQLYPINITKDCEWKRKTNCGGGKFPIVGCIDGKQVNRHHGPDKSTVNNSEGNVHRICATCHNLWHEWNDAVPMPSEPHKPKEASPEELAIWNSKMRPKAPYSRRQMHLERDKND